MTEYEISFRDENEFFASLKWNKLSTEILWKTNLLSKIPNTMALYVGHKISFSSETSHP